MLEELNLGFPCPHKLPTSVNAHPDHDPFLVGGQMVLESKWTKKLESALGPAVLGLNSKHSFSALMQPLYKTGNSRDATGFLIYDYNPVIGAALMTYTLESFPCYLEEFPIKEIGEYLENPASPNKNKAYRTGVMLGKAGKARAWEINYRYQGLEADA